MSARGDDHGWISGPGTPPVPHPAWCHRETCGVRMHAGYPMGAHRSKPVVIPGVGEHPLNVEISLWQLIGQPVSVTFDLNQEIDGFGFDVPEARNVARILLELADLAEGGAS